MDAQDVLRDVGVIFGAALVAVPIAALLRVPVMIVLVAVGALVGPSVLGFVSNPVEGLGAQLVFTLGVSLILFHGGARDLAAGDLAHGRWARAAGPARDRDHRARRRTRRHAGFSAPRSRWR